MDATNPSDAPHAESGTPNGVTGVAAPRAFALDPRIVHLWSIEAAIFGAVVFVASVLPVLVTGRWWGLVPAMVLPFALVLAMVLHARAYADRFRATLLDDGLLVERGVWWRTETFVPRARVQHTDVSQGPLGRHFGVATLKVFTAGSQLGQIEVKGLPRDAATTLRDALLGRSDRDGV